MKSKEEVWVMCDVLRAQGKLSDDMDSFADWILGNDNTEKLFKRLSIRTNSEEDEN